MNHTKVITDYGFSVKDKDITILIGEASNSTDLMTVNSFVKAKDSNRVGLFKTVEFGNKLIAVVELEKRHSEYLEIYELSIRSIALAWINPSSQEPIAVVADKFNFSMKQQTSAK